MIHILSASMGGYDNPNPPPQLEGCTATMVTDDEQFGEWSARLGWQVIYHAYPHTHPRLGAKVPKCKPHHFFPHPVETIVWLDGAARITNEARFLEVVKGVPLTEPIAQFLHPDRDDVEDEAKASEGMEKYGGMQVRDQAHHYKMRGLPSCWGLWATGMIVYHPAAFDIEAFGNAWLAEQLMWTYQDQLSEPYLLWKADYKPRALPQNLRSNDYIAWMPHTRAD